MDSRQVQQVGPQRTQQLTILEIVFAGAIAAILTGGIFTLWTTMVGVTLLLALHAYDARSDFSWIQSAAFSAVWAFSVILSIGVFLNFMWPDEPLWSNLAYACKQGVKGSELAELAPSNPVYVCTAGPFFEPDSRDEFLVGINPGDIEFMGIWLVFGVLMFAFRRTRYRQTRETR